MSNRPCTPSPIKPTIRSAEDKMGSLDVISGLFSACSISISLSGEYVGRISNTMGGTITIPIPIETITINIIEVIGAIVILFTWLLLLARVL
jgi:hypothetical protein